MAVNTAVKYVTSVVLSCRLGGGRLCGQDCGCTEVSSWILVQTDGNVIVHGFI